MKRLGKLGIQGAAIAMMALLLWGCDDDGDSSGNTAPSAPSAPASSAPVASVSAEPTHGRSPLVVAFDGRGSIDPDGGSIVSYAWDFGDGTASSDPAPTHTYAEGVYLASLIVTDDEGEQDMTTTGIVTGTSTLSFQNVNAPAQEVYFDNILIGVVPEGQTWTWWVPSGSHQVRAYDSRYGSLTETVVLVPGGVSSMEVFLRFSNAGTSASDRRQTHRYRKEALLAP